MFRNRWLFGLTAGLVLTGAFAGYWWGRGVGRPPAPAAAALPVSARMLLQPFRKDAVELTVAPHGETDYRVGMDAGASLVYSWASSGGAVSWRFAGQNQGQARDAHRAFVAQSSGWYVWRWSNGTSDPAVIHLKLNGYYQPFVIP